MHKLLITTALSLSLLGGAALAQTSATGSGDAASSTGASVDGTSVDGGVSVGATGAATATTGDASATGSVSANADASATASADSDFMGQLGDSADQFFTGDNNDQLRPDEEISANFAALNDDQQTEIKNRCNDVGASSTGYGKNVVDLCAKIGAMCSQTASQ